MTSSCYPSKPILIVDDEPQILSTLQNVLLTAGMDNVQTCADSRDVENLIADNFPSLVLLDLTMPYISGDTLLEKIHSEYPGLPIVVITGTNEVETAVSCIRKGAKDYLVKSIENNKLIASVKNALQIEDLKNENTLLRDKLLFGSDTPPPEFSSIVTADRKMISLFHYLAAIACSNHPILIQGETGTGKELIAQSIHDASKKEGELVRINAAGLDDTMFSDTLFGHKKGAFTGAMEKRSGLIEKAAGGTLFLDEIGDLTINSQVKLLRLLENGEYYAIGSDIVHKSSCRIIAATHQSLERLLESGQFRKDLYYRLSSYEVSIPPLRERSSDIPLIADYFIDILSIDARKERPVVEPSFYNKLYEKPFPGNVRELHSLILHVLSIAGDGPITGNMLEGDEQYLTGPGKIYSKSEEIGEGEKDSKKIVFTDKLPTLKEGNQILVQEALKRTGGNISQAATLLGISQPALSKRISKMEIKEEY